MTTPKKPNELYIATLLIEFFISAIARLTLYGLFVLVPVSLLIAGLLFVPSYDWQRIFTAVLFLIWLIGMIVGYGPIVLSILAYLGFGSGHTLTRFSLGAREPSQREQKKIMVVVKRAVKSSGKTKLKGFSGIYVVDSPLEYSYLIGTTLYVSSGAIGSRHFQASVTHEMGHLQHGDGATILALRRFIFPLFYVFIRNVRDFSTSKPNSKGDEYKLSPADIFYNMLNQLIFFLFSITGGGLGVWLTSWFWAKYFRAADYAADEFVVKRRQKGQLLAYLEEKRFYDTSVPYMMGWQPANEQRIDRVG
ncbi:hypothetical protein [Candidatus Leptofilum sp.]|uniref:hypothetical protein n=1 Tax=Candidatus Leptofilum sp. TaxID=3241576 RepID=UPI003B5A175C